MQQSDNLTVDIRKLIPDEVTSFIELVRLFEDVFEMDSFKLPTISHLKKLLKKQDFGVFIAVHVDELVGGLTTYELVQYYSERSLVYIFDLAVKPTMQRRGIGKQLVDQTIAYYRANGFEEVFVQANQDEPHAMDFYRSTKPTNAEEVIHFYYEL